MLLDEEAKEAWLANVPAVILEEERQTKRLDQSTKDGIYNRVLVETEDKELAERLANEYVMAKKLAEAAAAIPNKAN